MSPFYGRNRELNELHHLTRKKTASLVAVTGRRRIGKSRLLNEFALRNPDYRFAVLSGLAPDQGITPRVQRSEFARQMERQFSLSPVATDDWGDLFSHLAAQVTEGKWIVLLDEVSWLGMRDSQFLPKLKNAWDLEFKKNDQLILVLCGSVSSWIERNLLSSTGFVGRVSLSLRVEELTASESMGFWRESNTSANDKLKILGVVGGVPRYLEEVIPSLSADENIKRLCFQPGGILFNEYDQIFTDLFSKRSSEYKRIVEHLVDSPATIESICEALSLQRNGVTSKRLGDLVSAGFLTRNTPWDLVTGRSKKGAPLRISDNYLRFYLKYIRPNREVIESGRFSDKPVSALPAWDTIMGFQFENLVLRNRRFVWESCGLTPGEIAHDGPYTQRASARREGCQIDYLIQSRQGPLYICEIKFSRTPIGLGVLQEIREKIRRLKAPSHCSLIPVLIHVNGVTEQLQYSDDLINIVDFTKILT